MRCNRNEHRRTTVPDEHHAPLSPRRRSRTASRIVQPVCLLLLLPAEQKKMLECVHFFRISPHFCAAAASLISQMVQCLSDIEEFATVE